MFGGIACFGLLWRVPEEVLRVEGSGVFTYLCSRNRSVNVRLLLNLPISKVYENMDDFLAGILFITIFGFGVWGGWKVGTQYKPLVDAITQGKFQ